MELDVEEVKRLVIAIFKQDKTPAYGYSRKERDQTRFGREPGAGKRWQTPAELAQQFARKHNFNDELFKP